MCRCWHRNNGLYFSFGAECVVKSLERWSSDQTWSEVRVHPQDQTAFGTGLPSCGRCCTSVAVWKNLQGEDIFTARSWANPPLLWADVDWETDCPWQPTTTATCTQRVLECLLESSSWSILDKQIVWGLAPVYHVHYRVQSSLHLASTSKFAERDLNGQKKVID